jgi:hypothetical protein
MVYIHSVALDGTRVRNSHSTIQHYTTTDSVAS